MSKSELSADTGASCAVIERYLHILAENRLIKSSYSTAKIGQKKTKRYYISPDKYAAVFELNDTELSIYFVSLSGKIKEKFAYVYNHDIEEARNIGHFLNGKNYYFTRLRYSNCIGALVLLPRDIDNRSDKQTVRTLPFGTTGLKMLMDGISDLKNITYTQLRKATLISVADSLEEKDTTLVLFLDKCRYSSCCLTHNADANNICFTEFGRNYKIKNISLKDYVELISEPEHVVSTFAAFIGELSDAVYISKVFLCGNAYTHMDALAELIGDKLTPKKLSVQSIDTSHVIINAANRVRDAYIAHITASYLNK